MTRPGDPSGAEIIAITDQAEDSGGRGFRTLSWRIRDHVHMDATVARPASFCIISGVRVAAISADRTRPARTVEEPKRTGAARFLSPADPPDPRRVS